MFMSRPKSHPKAHKAVEYIVIIFTDMMYHDVAWGNML